MGLGKGDSSVPVQGFAAGGAGAAVSAGVAAHWHPTAPVGSMHAYAGDEAPIGWALCYGQAFDVDEWPHLFEVIGYKFGFEVQGNGLPDKFRVPDLRGRVPVGPDSMGGAGAGRAPGLNQPGDVAGSSSIKLGSNHMPVHGHTASSTSTTTPSVSAWSVTSDGQGANHQHEQGLEYPTYTVQKYSSGDGFTHSWAVKRAITGSPTGGSTTSDHTHNVTAGVSVTATTTTSTTVNNTVSPNLPFFLYQPSVALNWIIKT